MLLMGAGCLFAEKGTLPPNPHPGKPGVGFYMNDVQLCISCPYPFQKEKQIEEYLEKVTTLI